MAIHFPSTAKQGRARRRQASQPLTRLAPNPEFDAGAKAHQNGDLNLALEKYQSVLLSDPSHWLAKSNLGTVLIQQGKLTEGVREIEASLRINGRQPHSMNSLGIAFLRQKKYAEAILILQQAIQIKPGYVEAYINWGNVLKEQDDLEQASELYQAALKIDPNNPDAFHNWGVVLFQQQNLSQALRCYEHALATKPSISPEVRFDRAGILLMCGDFEQGWQEYESRWDKQSIAPLRRDFVQPLWLGQFDLKGQTILIHAEQGLGDTIQFCRYLPSLLAMCGQVILEVYQPLVGLMQQSFSTGVLVVAKGESLPSFDAHCPMMSLPLAFKTNLSNIPASVPYLFPSVQAESVWQSKLGKQTRKRVGLVWSGNVLNETDTQRSVGLKALASILSDEFEFHCLQKEIRPDDLAHVSELKQRGISLHIHADSLRSFDDTAALLSQMDLVMSVDTAVAHLAGAMSKPVWILIAHVPDFRWLLDREDSPWYPSARLFRQPTRGDLGAVVRKLQVALRSL